MYSKDKRIAKANQKRELKKLSFLYIRKLDLKIQFIFYNING